jgi:hypothetical protein
MTKRNAGPARLDARKREVELDGTLSRRLTAYVASAVCRSPDILAAAVVGAAAVAGQPAAADIIINNTPITIPYPPSTSTFGGGRIIVPWSFDGGNKFSFSNVAGFGKYNTQFHEFLKLRALSGNGFLAGPLAKGVLIGPGESFKGSSALANLAYGTSGHYQGLWSDKSGYLGFEFTDSKGLHFGWAYLTVTCCFSGVLSEFAYDTVPGQSIEAGQTNSPEPGTLGLLALGSLGLAFWRRKKQPV